ncbi:hypothetical protein CDD81_1631 [Ophiocordyceps australis]|uniref:U1-type domain-containing protein n=1 Tax=Ophiocordyceps australis TaxID=1399860 RepID=A0A2C5XYF1_9HYPO|nr:hypothetical protein CDD81_1631 [Ophiocordyceps australis]
MSEYWKSTPKYWCKHCSCYVRDTKLERQNHESTARHQGAIKRSLRELHRTHERQEREKERARREIARLNGVVSKDTSNAPSPAKRSAASTRSEADLKRQRQQLADLGVAVPSTFRAEMAMAGDWTVTQSRVISSTGADGTETSKDAMATGVRKRHDVNRTEEEEEEEEAMRRLFKKPRRWGRDSKALPLEEDGELDALLSGTLLVKKEEAVKQESSNVHRDEEQKPSALELQKDDEQEAKAEPLTDIKKEPDDEASTLVEEPAPILFKKRRPKGIRIK